MALDLQYRAFKYGVKRHYTNDEVGRCLNLYFPTLSIRDFHKPEHRFCKQDFNGLFVNSMIEVLLKHNINYHVLFLPYFAGDIQISEEISSKMPSSSVLDSNRYTLDRTYAAINVYKDADLY